MKFRLLMLMWIGLLTGGYVVDSSANTGIIHGNDCGNMHIEERNTCKFSIERDSKLVLSSDRNFHQEVKLQSNIKQPNAPGCGYTIRLLSVSNFTGNKTETRTSLDRIQLSGQNSLDFNFILSANPNMGCNVNGIALDIQFLITEPNGATTELVSYNEWLAIPFPQITKATVPSKVTMVYDAKTQVAEVVFPIFVESTKGARLSVKDQHTNSDRLITLFSTDSSDKVEAYISFCRKLEGEWCQPGSLELLSGSSFSFNNNGSFQSDEEYQVNIGLKSKPLISQKAGRYTGVAVVLFEAI